MAVGMQHSCLTYTDWLIVGLIGLWDSRWLVSPGMPSWPSLPGRSLGEAQALGTIPDHYEHHFVTGIVLGIRGEAAKPTRFLSSKTTMSRKHKGHPTIFQMCSKANAELFGELAPTGITEDVYYLSFINCIPHASPSLTSTSNPSMSRLSSTSKTYPLSSTCRSP